MKLVAKFAAGVVDTGGKFAAGIVDTGGKFATGINNTSETGGKIFCSFDPIYIDDLRSKIFALLKSLKIRVH